MINLFNFVQNNKFLILIIPDISRGVIVEKLMFENKKGHAN